MVNLKIMKHIYPTYFFRPLFLGCVMAPRDAPWPRGPARRTVAVAAGLAVASCSGEAPSCQMTKVWENYGKIHVSFPLSCPLFMGKH